MFLYWLPWLLRMESMNKAASFSSMLSEIKMKKMEEVQQSKVPDIVHVHEDYLGKHGTERQSTDMYVSLAGNLANTRFPLYKERARVADSAVAAAEAWSPVESDTSLPGLVAVAGARPAQPSLLERDLKVANTCR